MGPLTIQRIAELLQPYFAGPVAEEICGRIGIYLELFAKWSGRVSLSSVKEPSQIVQRHFGESFFLAQHLPKQAKTLLDFGSGAGFPGIPVALLRPGLEITLAESQGRKAAFLRETVFELGLQAKVWPDRVEKMPPGQVFDVVALRAVDKMESALQLAANRVGATGLLAFLAGEGTSDLPDPEKWEKTEVPVPLSSARVVLSTKLS